MLLRKVKEEGRTILEVVAVLVIMLILTLGGLYLYERVVAKMGAKDLAEEVATLATKNRLELTHSERVSEKSTKREGRGKLSSSPE
ncbi:MAG: hypothetical protein J6T55_03815, partial [Alphaproteobacteria bacterium]|nr:hypothetical protein [Alphaproteobacteria bacterium]